MIQARAIYYPMDPQEAVRRQAEEAVSQFGFYTSVEYTAEDMAPNGASVEDAPAGVFLHVTARHVYRLYINGQIIMHGPARTAHGYARVDEIDITECLTPGLNHIALEVMTYGDLYCGYSNDISLSDGPGFVIAEIQAGDRVLTATGQAAFPWKVCRIRARKTRTGRLSHCREASEIYRLEDDYYLWRLGMGAFVEPALVEELPTLLPHKALLPTLEAHAFHDLMGYGTCHIQDTMHLSPLFFETNENYTPKGYYESLDEHPLMDCRKTVDTHEGVRMTRDAEGWTLTPTNPEASTWILLDGGENFVGFPAIDCTCEHAGIVDVVHAEVLTPEGNLAYHHNIVTRLYVPAGLSSFAAMEPGVGRYMKVYFRGCGQVTVHNVAMLDDAYPDEHRATFLCSDDQINHLYQAARRTLLDNTLDIFMDCPDRERGGWLCDSLWTSRAAALMLSDTRVEKEFLENFLLTPADQMFHGFFPEAYPGQKPSYLQMTGITTWSFWLLCELCEFIQRTGDLSFRDTFAERVAAFVEGSRTFIGESGLLENLPWLFIDWSLSNLGEYQTPISTPANALYAYMLIQLGQTFEQPAWVERGEHMRQILREALVGTDPSRLSTMTTFPDHISRDADGTWHKGGHISETGMATALWANLFAPGEVPAMDRYFRDRMGPAPLYTSDPTIGKSQLFIGLCIRLDTLARRGHFPKLWEDLQAIYMPQLREGPGTLWEVTGIDASSRCHGFTSHAGVHLVRDVLGMDIPMQITETPGAKKTLRVSPHLCGLRWARGTQEVAEGIISVSWQYDGDSFALTVILPEAYECLLTLPREVKMLEPDKVNVHILHT